MEYYAIRERTKSGIPLPPAVVDELKQLAGVLNLPDRLE
jgi:LDH2 family malate/lactate/ureidoglycolate dehydrogenase